MTPDKPSILHLFPNEKFVDIAARQFEQVFPGQNTFFVFTDDPLHQRTVFAQSTGRLERVGAAADRAELVKRIEAFDLVFLHSIYFKFARLVPEIKVGVPVVWVFWGSEVYNSIPEAERRAVGPLTARYRYRPVEVCLRFLKSLYDRLAMGVSARYQARLNRRELEGVVDRVDYVASYMEEDLEEVRRYVRLPRSKTFWYAYSDLAQITGGRDEVARGDGVLLGNSATWTNNHLEALEILARLELGGRRVVAPLNYGEASYRDFVMERVPVSLKDRFHALTEFLPMEEYNRCLLECPVAIMNHYRQQAVTTIVALLWFGTKVYLSERNPILRFYRRQGLRVFSIEEELVVSNRGWAEPLTFAEIMENRSILTGLLASEEIAARLAAGVAEVRGR